MITISVPYITCEYSTKIINDLRRVQSSAIRTSYNLAWNGQTKVDIEKALQQRFPTFDKFLLRCASERGISDKKSDESLNKPRRVYGSRKSLIARSNDKITKEEWKQKRLCPLYVIGEANQTGNRKFNFISETEIEFKPYKGIKILLKLNVMNKNYSRRIIRAFDMANNGELPITISIKSDKINFTFDLSLVDNDLNYVPVKNRYSGIDLNPNYIGISIIEKEKVISTKLFSLNAITGKHNNSNKLSHETYQVGHEIGRYLRHFKVDKVFLEELNFKQGDSGKGKNFNRLTKNNWPRNKLYSTLSKYFKLYYVNSAYSSTIGNILHSEYPDPVAASIEIGNRGYRLIICKSGLFYPSIISKECLPNLWKKEVDTDFETWIELHNYIKKTGLRYRVEIPNISMFRNFKSPKSRCHVVDNFLYK